MGLSLPLLDKVRYADEEEAQKILEEYISTERESSAEKVKNAIITLLKSPERKVRRATLNALRSTKFAEKDVVLSCAVMTKEDPEKSVRDLASEVVLDLLKIEDEALKKDLVRGIVKLISKGKAMIDVTDVVKSIGVEFAKSMLEDPELDSETKEYIQFAIEYLEKS